MMRLALIVPNFPKLSETFIVNKFLGLLEQGWDVYVLCGVSEPGQWKHFEELEGCQNARKRVIKTWRHRPRWLAALLFPWAVLSCFARNPAGGWRYFCRGFHKFGPDVLRRFYLDADLVALKPDLVHFEFGSLAVEKMYLKQLLGCKLTASFRGYDLNLSGRDQPDYFREVWAEADALHLLGEGLWQTARRRGCPATKPHALIPPAINVKFFNAGARAESASDRPLRILSVGRLTWEKGYEYAIEAIRLLAGQGVRSEWRIIGDGVMLEALAFIRHKAGLEQSVQFLGGLAPVRVREEMRAADIFLHASVSEGFGNAVIEAQAMGLPIVCSDAGGLPENVCNDETGFVAPRRNAAALAAKLAILARDPALRQRMGQAGRRRVLERFEISGQIQAFDRLYREVLSNNPRGANGPAGRQEMFDLVSTVPNEK